jgi:hypothetical protein
MLEALKMLDPPAPLSQSAQEKHDPKRQKEQLLRRACDIGIAEGGARTHDLEVDLFAVNKSHTLYQLSYPGKGVIDGEVV